MTLSPSRSYRSFPDSPNTRNNAKWWTSTNLLKAALPACFVLLFTASVYFYWRITSQASFNLYASDASVSSSLHTSRQWLYSQVKQVADIEDKFHPGISAEQLMEMDPFSISSGINVWDLYPPVLSCPDVIRIGKIGEGGKWVCGLQQLATEEQCIMYSFGISTDISFEVEILMRTTCIIHAFDPTVGKLPYHNLSPQLMAAMTAEQRGRIRFHKTAMGAHSGTSPVHSFNEQLYDIMHRLGHSFIHLLKVDIEGGEWGVFRSVFDQRPRRGGGIVSSALPVGQLIIELHYHTMADIEQFFTGAERHGLLPFSREINLQPCIAGGRPLAAEYSFIHTENYFAGSRGAHAGVPAAFTPSWHVPIRAVIYFLTQQARLPRMTRALQLLYENFWRDYPHYPVLIFHDDLRPADQHALQNAVPGMPLRFVLLTLAVPEALRTSGVVIPDRTRCAPDSSTLGYRHMCRFHATGVHAQLTDLGYAHYEYVMRLDDDSLLTAPVGYDLFRFMKENHKKYAFPNMVSDDPACVVDLWEHSEAFFNASVPTRRNESLFTHWPRGVVFYNNFEISAMSLWSDPLWKAFMARIDALGGIYTLRWGDAPLHTIGVTMMLGRSAIHAFTDIGYRHDPFIDQAPTGLPMPHMDPFVGPNVACHYYDKWMCYYVHHGHNVSFNSSMDSNAANGTYFPPQLFAEMSLEHQMKHMHYLDTHQLLERTGDMTARAGVVAFQGTVRPDDKPVLYTFAHAGREDRLIATLRSFQANYLAAHPAPIVVFYNANSAFKMDVVTTGLEDLALSQAVKFEPVTLPSLSQYLVDERCVPATEEVRAASVFLRRAAMDKLRAMGYAWLLRIGDDARLRSTTVQNIFETLKPAGGLYGYRHAAISSPDCVSDLWGLAQHLCGLPSSTTSTQHRRDLRNQPHSRGRVPPSTEGDTVKRLCSSMIENWAPLHVIVTSFAVSHVSVWESPQCIRLLDAVTPTPGGKKLPLWSDAAIHTLCVIATLQPAQVITLTDVDYQYLWEHKADYTSSTIEPYNHAFDLQRLGWLGGDVAASVVLPTLSPGAPAGQVDRALWLFGDSLIGVSDANRRIKEHSTMISNTVGVARYGGTTADGSCQRTVEAVTYFWSTNADGSPQAVLDLAPRHACRRELQRVWPISGVAVVVESTQTVKVLLLVQVVCMREGATMAGLTQMHTYETALVVVHNPTDSPQAWRYDLKYFPSLTSGKLYWVSVSAASGAAFARSGEHLYLMGGYYPERPDAAIASSAGYAGHHVLGRLSVADALALDLTQCEGLTAGRTPWQPIYTSSTASTAASLYPIFAPHASEASLHFDGRLQEWVAVTLLFWEERIHVCRTQNISTAKAWSCGYVTAIPVLPKTISYAAKAHPHLLDASCAASSPATSPALDMVVSYVANAEDSADILFEPEHRQTYTPKFLRVQSAPPSATSPSP